MDNTNNLPANQSIALDQNPITMLKNLASFSKLKDFDKVGHLIIPICNKHAVLSGIDKEIDMFTKEEIAKYTSLNLKNLTLEEVELAFQNERFNLYDKKTIHYNFFSIDYFVEIISKYKIWKQEKMKTHNIPLYQNILPEQSNSSLEFEKKKIRKEFICQVYKELHETKIEFVGDSFTLYEDFIQHKLINVTDQEKIDLYKVMLKRVKTEVSNDIAKTLNPSLRNDLKQLLNKLKTNNSSKENLIINRCKAYLVSKSILSYNSVDAILKKMNL